MLATIGLFTTLSYWNDWWLSLMLIGKENLYNLQSTIYQVLSNLAFLSNSTLNGNSNVVLDISNLPNETARMAMALFAIGPILLVYPFMQRYFVKGLTIGAVKG